MKKDLSLYAFGIGVIFGLAMIVMGIKALDLGEYAEYASFGGDFYTYSYEATRYAANNLVQLIKTVGHLIISLGLFDIAYFAGKLCEKLPIKQENTGDAESGSVQEEEGVDADAE